MNVREGALRKESGNMKQKMYSVYDLKAKTYLSPFFCVNDSVASRMVSMSMRAGDSMVGQCPEDFNLQRVGDFDTDTGVIYPAVPIMMVCPCANLVKEA